MKTIETQIKTVNKTFSVNEEESFHRMIATPLGSRVLRPSFGSSMHELIDRNMDEHWKLLFRKYLFECFFAPDNTPWDERIVPTGVSLDDLDTTKGEVEATISFEDFELTTTLKGF